MTLQLVDDKGRNRGPQLEVRLESGGAKLSIEVEKPSHQAAEALNKIKSAESAKK